MSNIILAELLSVLWHDEVVRIYEAEGRKYITTMGARDILESDDDYIISLIDSNIRVTSVLIKPDKDYGYVVEIVVRRVKMK